MTVFKGRRGILLGTAELAEAGILPTNVLNMLVVLEESMTDDCTLRVDDDGRVEIRTQGLIILGGNDPEPCDELGCHCRNHFPVL